VKEATPVFCCDMHKELWKDEEENRYKGNDLNE